jgi:hypothetical protein
LTEENLNRRDIRVPTSEQMRHPISDDPSNCA